MVPLDDQPILFRTTQLGGGTVTIPLQLEGKPMMALADTGANRNFVTPSSAKELGLTVLPADVKSSRIIVASRQVTSGFATNPTQTSKSATL